MEDIAKNIGYLEGTDPTFLTQLALKGIGTVPLSNGADNHGKYIGHLTKNDNISIVVGYFHKVIPPPTYNITTRDILDACLRQEIPVVLIAPKELHKDCRNRLKDIGGDIEIVDINNVLTQTLSELK